MSDTDEVRIPTKIEAEEAAFKLKKQQAKVKSKYDFLRMVSVKEFQAVYVKTQAEEICKYLGEMQMTPLNAWYSKLLELVSSGPFMSQFYLTFNEFNIVVPDYEKINTLILPDPGPEDFPRSSLASS
jgi:hypothetical protein